MAVKPLPTMLAMSLSWKARPQSPSFGASSMFEMLTHLPSRKVAPVLGIAAAAGVKAAGGGGGGGTGAGGGGGGAGGGITAVGPPPPLPPPPPPQEPARSATRLTARMRPNGLRANRSALITMRHLRP